MRDGVLLFMRAKKATDACNGAACGHRKDPRAASAASATAGLAAVESRDLSGSTSGRDRDEVATAAE